MITSRMHGYIDYVMVMVFILAPDLLGLTDWAAVLSYSLGIVHLLLTAFTAFSSGYIRMIPFRVHGWVELTVGLLLGGGSYLVGGPFSSTDRIFFTVCGIVILLTWVVTGYRSPLEAPPVPQEDDKSLF